MNNDLRKTDLLFQMMEHPDEYTAHQWQEILDDEECSELYTIMSKVKSSIDLQRFDKQFSDEMIDDEWWKLIDCGKQEQENFCRRADICCLQYHPELSVCPGDAS